MAILDDSCYLAAEDRFNLFIAKRNADALNDEVRVRSLCPGALVNHAVGRV